MQVKVEIMAYGRDEVKTLSETLAFVADHMPEQSAGVIYNGAAQVGSGMTNAPPVEAPDEVVAAGEAERQKRKRRTKAEIEAEEKAAAEAKAAAEPKPEVSANPENRTDPAAEAEGEAEEDDGLAGLMGDLDPPPALEPVVRTKEEAAAFMASTVRPALSEYIKKHSQEDAKKILQGLGYRSLAEVPPEGLDALLAAVQKAM